MLIVVVGAGEVGSYLAERLSRESHDVVVVEQEPALAHDLSGRLDATIVTGSGSSPSVLEEAGLADADLLIAVTDRDEVNLVACLLARQHGVPSTVVRVEDRDLRDSVRFAASGGLRADLVIDPDHETADEIIQLVEFRGVDEVYPMAGGDVIVLGARIRPGAPLAGRGLARIAAEHEPHWEFLFGTITRGHETFIPRGDHVLEAGDHVRVLTRHRARDQILRLLGIDRERAHRVMVLGGGRTGGLVAAALEARGMSVTVVDRDPQRAHELSMMLPRSVVVCGEVTDGELLLQERVQEADVVVAATGEDDANALACSYAKSEGAAWSITVVHRLSLLPLLPTLGIDAIVSPGRPARTRCCGSCGAASR
ncbi:MAG: Trk system potassium transporter TrkA [Acidimicrobiia bacterium]|nr:Trk system potassium transporter TrkA [Acidimicrobiia bacterium]